MTVIVDKYLDKMSLPDLSLLDLSGEASTEADDNSGGHICTATLLNKNPEVMEEMIKILPRKDVISMRAVCSTWRQTMLELPEFWKK